ncbi:MAG: paraquat-inducible protein A [Planctomycetota bacterium]
MSASPEEFSPVKHLKACHCCGLIQIVPQDSPSSRYSCVRCGTTISARVNRQLSESRTAAAAVGAFALFWPAITLPILEIEQLGIESRSSILSGIIELFHHGSYFVGAIVLLFSIIFPFAKILLLLELSMFEWFQKKHRARTLRLMEHVGKWSMMDVMLLAFFVMLVKLGDLVEFHFGPAIFAFVLCVAMSMVASLCFDPHAIWEEME